MANTIPANNNTSLYNTVPGNAAPINANVYATNVLASGFVSAAGNIYTSGFYFGDGSQLTNLPPSPSNYGNGNVTALMASFGSNTVSTTGNISGGYLLGNGSQLTGIVTSSYGNSNVASYLPTYSGALNPSTVSAAGNVTGNYILGNGSQLTGLPATYSNANVVSLMATFGSNTVSTTGNITGGYILGNGSQLTGLPATYGNSNVSSYLASGTNSANIITTANVQGGNLKTSGTGGNITGANYIQGNFFVGDGSQLTNVTATSNYSNSNVTALMASFGSNTISTTGNISGGYLFGNGSQLTGIVTSSYGNSNVNTLLAAWGSNALSTTGNVTASYHVGNGSLLSSITGANVSGTVANATYAVSAGTATSATTAATVTTAAQPNITTVGTLTVVNTSGAVSAVGNITGGNLSIGNNATVGGNLSVVGTIFGNFAGNITGNFVVPGANTDVIYNNSGNAGASNNFTFNSATNQLSVAGNIVGANINGNGSGLSSITGANVSGTVANATYATSAGSATTATNATHATVADSANAVAGGNVLGSVAQANYANTANSISGANVSGSVAQANYANTANAVAGGNVSGQVANALVAGTVYTPAQPVITSVGTLTSLSVSGNITTAGILTNGYYYANGTPVTFGGGSTYGNSNVVTLLAGFGSNTISTSGNITAGNLTITGTETDTGNITGGNILTGGVVSATGTVAGSQLISGAVTITGTDGTSGQVLTTYGNGITYFSTVSGGSGSPGGANTQLQFNDGGAFAGNAAMTFDKTSGNIVLGNIYHNNLSIIPGGVVPNAAITGNTNPSRLIIGNAYAGNVNWSLAINTSGSAQASGAGARVLQSDIYNYSNAATRLSGISLQNYYIQNANISNAIGNSPINNLQIFGMIGGNTALTTGYTNYATNTAAVQGINNSLVVGYGTNSLLSGVGNTRVSFVRGATNTVSLNPGSNIDVAMGTVSAILQTNNSGTGVYANIANAVGFVSLCTSGSNGLSAVNQSTNFTHYYVPGDSSSILTSANAGISALTGNVVRAATNYYAFRNDDDLAKVRLGSLNRFHEFQYSAGNTTGTITISKTNGQVQYVALTGNLTISSFSNFVTTTATPQGNTVYQADTVTLMLDQGTTGGYSVTFPTDGTCKFAGGISAVGTVTANTVTMASVTGYYNPTAAATNYLITISPGFA